MDSREPAGRKDRGGERLLRRNYPLKLTLRQHQLLERAATCEKRSKASLLAERLAGFFADLERRFPDHQLRGRTDG